MPSSNFPAAALPFAVSTPLLADIVAGSNRELINAVQKLAAGESKIFSVYVWGEHGSGRSTLLRAAYNEAKRCGLTAYYAAADDDKQDVLPPLGDGLLVVDDVGALPASAQITLFDWHNRAAVTRQQFILASGDCAPPATALNGELRSRLSAGLVFQLQPLSDDEKNAALSVWAEKRGFTLPPEISALLLSRLPRNMHTLTAALAELDAFFLKEQKPLTLKRASAWLNKRPPDTPLLSP